LAAPEDLDASEPWFLVSTPNSSSLIARSDDAGRTWNLVGGPPAQDTLRWAFRLDDRTLVLVGDDRHWWSRDDGATWDDAENPRKVFDAAGTGADVWLATDDGVYQFEPGQTATLHLDTGPFSFVSAGGGEVAAIDLDGRLQLWQGGTSWSTRRGVAGKFSATTPDGGYAGEVTGLVYRWDGSAYASCGAIPPVPDAEYDDIVALTVDGTRLWAATATRAAYVSEDGCRTWEERKLAEDTVYDLEGAARDVDEAYPVLLARGDRLIVAGWVGYATSDDAGGTWNEPTIVPPDYTRGVAFGLDDFVVYSAGYASGVAFTTDGGVAWQAPGDGLEAVNAQKVGLPYDAELPWDVWAVVGHAFVRSRDGGYTWEQPDSPYGIQVQEAAAFGTVDHVWIFPLNSADISAGALLESTDGGATWAPPAGLGEIFEGAYGRGVYPATDTDGSPMWCASSFEPVRIACQREGEQWAQSYEADATAVAGPVSPAPGVLVLGADGELRRSVDGGLSWVEMDPGLDAAAELLQVTDDGTLFLTTGSARLFRSLDDGATWEDLDLQFGAPVYDLRGRPDFAHFPDLLVATHDGLFRVVHATGTEPAIVRFGAWQRVDDWSDLWLCPSGNCGTEEDDTSAAFDQVRRLDEGTEIDVWVRGDSVRLTGRAEGTGTVEIVLDGEVVGTLGPTVVDPVGELWSASGLGDGWHELTLLSLVGDGVAIDGVEARMSDTVLSREPETDADTDADADADTDTDPGDDTGPGLDDTSGRPPGRCACGSTAPAAAAPALAAIGLLLARRRRTSRRTSVGSNDVPGGGRIGGTR